MITDSDAATAPFVAVVNEAFVRKCLQGKDPLNKQLDMDGLDTGMPTPYTIVGVLGDQVDDQVGAAPQPAVFLAQAQIPTRSLFYPALLQTIVTFVVRTKGDVAVSDEMRTIFRQVAPDYALDNFQTMQEAVNKNTFNQRLGLYLVASFAGMAVLMVVAGLYGVLSQLVGYRQREIGIRMAVGATRQSVAKLILGQGSLLIAGGLVLGLIVSIGLGRLVSGFLYQVKPLDPWTYLGTAITLTVVGLVAALLPAHRAASLEPLAALRDE